MSLDKEVETNLPEYSAPFKVVQMKLYGKPILRFPTRHFRNFHVHILEDTLEIAGIEYKLIEGQDGDLVPATQGENYEVQGMGRALVNIEKKEAKFVGSSHDYQMDISREHLEEMRQILPEWTLV